MDQTRVPTLSQSDYTKRIYHFLIALTILALVCGAWLMVKKSQDDANARSVEIQQCVRLNAAGYTNRSCF